MLTTLLSLPLDTIALALGPETPPPATSGLLTILSFAHTLAHWKRRREGHRKLTAAVKGTCEGADTCDLQGRRRFYLLQSQLADQRAPKTLRKLAQWTV